MAKLGKRLWIDEGGATMVEYGLIVALVSVVSIAAMQAIGTNLAASYHIVSTTLNDSAAPANPPPAASDQRNLLIRRTAHALPPFLISRNATISGLLR